MNIIPDPGVIIFKPETSPIKGAVALPTRRRVEVEKSIIGPETT